METTLTFLPRNGVEQRTVNGDILADDDGHVDESGRGGARRQLVISGGGNHRQAGSRQGFGRVEAGLARDCRLEMGAGSAGQRRLEMGAPRDERLAPDSRTMRRTPW